MAMPTGAWRTARDLAAALAVLAVVQLALSLAIAGSMGAVMLAAEVALAVMLGAIALLAHIRLQGEASV